MSMFILHGYVSSNRSAKMQPLDTVIHLLCASKCVTESCSFTRVIYCSFLSNTLAPHFRRYNMQTHRWFHVSVTSSVAVCRHCSCQTFPSSLIAPSSASCCVQFQARCTQIIFNVWRRQRNSSISKSTCFLFFFVPATSGVASVH